MGKATRWLKGIFGIKSSNNNENAENANKNLYSGDRRRYTPPPPPQAEAAWLKSYYGESEKEQSKHAIAVAAATAAAADAAVAAAQAAVAVVRLTSRGSMFSGGGGMVVELAAMKIQATFRGYLARKALRALKGLVKIQALVRGYLVRKQASATFHCMQALIRAQATVRNKRSLSRLPTPTQTHTQIQTATTTHDLYNYPRSEIRARRSVDNLDHDTRSEHAASPSVHSRRLSASFERRNIKPITEDTPKIVEMDPGRPRTPSRTYKTPTRHVLLSDTCDRDQAYPTPLSIPSCQHWHDTEWGLTGDECRFSTAHSTPRVMHTVGLLNPTPVTPTRSVCGDGRYSNYSRGDYNHNQFPNYMANTKSFCSKVRSQSAPKQRPENGFLVKKKMSLNEMMESRNSLSDVRMQRSCSQVQGAINFKNAIMGKLERSYDFNKDSHVYHLPSK